MIQRRVRDHIFNSFNFKIEISLKKFFYIFLSMNELENHNQISAARHATEIQQVEAYNNIGREIWT